MFRRFNRDQLTEPEPRYPVTDSALYRQALKHISELESENQRLRDENVRLKGALGYHQLVPEDMR